MERPHTTHKSKTKFSFKEYIRARVHHLSLMSYILGGLAIMILLVVGASLIVALLVGVLLGGVVSFVVARRIKKMFGRKQEKILDT